MRAVRGGGGARGFTLIELLVVVVLATVILGAIYQSIASTQRTTQAQVQRLYVRQETRAAALFLSYALRELDAADGDVGAPSSSALEIRGLRWAGPLCTDPQAVLGDVSFVLRDALQFGVRRPDAALDSILLFRDGDPGARTDDRWLLGALLAAAADTCPDGKAGTVVRASISAASGGNAAALAGVTAGSPMRGFQREQLSLYQDGGGAYWLGRRTADRGGTWTATQPLTGPLTVDGLAFAYFDTTGAIAATPAGIASVAIVVRGRSPERARLSGGRLGYVQDSVITRVTLRNNPRF